MLKEEALLEEAKRYQELEETYQGLASDHLSYDIGRSKEEVR